MNAKRKTESVKLKTDYSVRVSSRAKHVSIRVSHLGEVEVVVPKGFDQRRIPEILEKRQDWIAKTIQQVETERRSLRLETTESLPDTIPLRSLSEEWIVKYQYVSTLQTIARIGKSNQLTVTGQIDNLEICQQVLRRWLNHKAQLHLAPWLRQISKETGLSCANISVRGQKTLWASCSSKQNISLNYKLLFLPPNLVRYVFIHELCHTVYLNHSPKFWELVAAKEPDYKSLDKEVGRAWRYVPEWVERSPE